MKIFECQSCGQALYFENTACPRCAHRLGYLPNQQRLVALDPAGDDAFTVAGEPEERFRFCGNAAREVCNWLIPSGDAGSFCIACRHNHLIPNQSRPKNQALWQGMERAKHRLFYTLLELDLPLVTREEDPAEGLEFNFLEDVPDTRKVMTGHSRGRITISIAEADDSERERRRSAMREPYRTLLGHFRHEIGHYVWNRLVRDRPPHQAFRTLFGDERVSYRDSLRAHYDRGPAPDWAATYVSAYATSHPWEDFAETFAHYLHIVDALDTASELGIGVHPRHLSDAAALDADIDITPRHAASIEPLIVAWLPLTFAINNLNRSMGQTDFYPFVLSPGVIDKLGFVHDLVHGRVEREPLAQGRVAHDANLPVEEPSRTPTPVRVP